MKKAYHISSGQLISAEEADYNHYYGIFRCPSCEGIVTLRKGYQTNRGKEYSATFVHNKNAGNCKLKLTWDQIDNSNILTDSFENLSKGQKIAVLNKNILNAITDFLYMNSKDIRTDYSYIFIKDKTKDKIDQTKKTKMLDVFKKYSKSNLCFPFLEFYSYKESEKLLFFIFKDVVNSLDKKTLFKFNCNAEFLLYRFMLYKKDQPLTYTIFDILMFQEHDADSLDRYPIFSNLYSLQDDKKSEYIGFMFNKHCQVTRDTLSLISELNPKIVQKIFCIIMQTDTFYHRLLSNSYIDMYKDFTKIYIPKQDLGAICNRIDETKKSFIYNFIYELTFSLIQQVFYIDWYAYYYKWQKKSKIL